MQPSCHCHRLLFLLQLFSLDREWPRRAPGIFLSGCLEDALWVQGRGNETAIGGRTLMIEKGIFFKESWCLEGCCCSIFEPPQGRFSCNCPHQIAFKEWKVVRREKSAQVYNALIWVQSRSSPNLFVFGDPILKCAQESLLVIVCKFE